MPKLPMTEPYLWPLSATVPELLIKAYDRAVSLAFINNSGTVADRQAVAKLQSVDEKLKADLARAEYNRVKTKMRALSDQATMMAVISKNVELQWRNA